MKKNNFFTPTKFKVFFIIIILLIVGIPYTYKVCSNPFAWGDGSIEGIERANQVCMNKENYYYFVRPLWAWDNNFIIDASPVWKFNIYYFVAAIGIYYVLAGLIEKIYILIKRGIFR